MDAISTIDLPPPRIAFVERLLIAGIGERYAGASIAGIPAQWQRFAPHIGSLPTQIGYTTFGVCRAGDGRGSFEYVCGVEVTAFDGIPADWARVTIAGVRYAVFEHRDHVSAIKDTLTAISDAWLPASGYERGEAPDFERYGEAFDPRTGHGGLELWIPLADRSR